MNAQCFALARQVASVATAVVVVGEIASVAVGQATFQGLGFLSDPPGTTGSGALAISADGSVVVGYSASPDALREGFRWTRDEGMVGLGFLTDFHHNSMALGVTADGAAIVGINQLSFDTPIQEAFRWTVQDGLEGLGFLPGPHDNIYSWAVDVSDDGEVVVGTADGRAMRWTREEGMIDLAPGSISGHAHGVSANGAVIVGTIGLGGINREAFRWTEDGGVVRLGGFLDEDHPAFASQARAVSRDGSIVVGSSRVGSGLLQDAFRWTATEGMISLGRLPGGSVGAVAYAVSDDGSVIVGASETVDGPVAFIWDPVHGMRNLRSVLVDEFGLDLTGWTLTSANDVSADGWTIVGEGRRSESIASSEAWIVTLPSPCPTDLNGDGIVDAMDLVRVAHALRTRGDVPEDLDGDGVVTPRDLLLVIRRFGPCP